MFEDHQLKASNFDIIDFKESLKDLDSIRFQPIRIACKLRCLQKESKFHLIDLYNTIEAFREFGLNSFNSDLNALISNAEVYTIVFSIFDQLNRRTPFSMNIDQNHSAKLVYYWLLETFNNVPEGYMKVLPFKIALTLLSASLYSNKLKYLFTLLANEDGFMQTAHFKLFQSYIVEIYQYFGGCFTDSDNDFAPNKSLNLDMFIESLTKNDNQCEAFSWLIVYHRLVDAETVEHNIVCDGCGKHPFTGFRYRCKICSNCNLCQDCFWTGKATKNHDPDKHPCKEYLFDNSKNQFRRSFRKSFRNRWFSSSSSSSTAGKQANNNNSKNNNENDDRLIVKKLNLSNIISPKVARKNQTPFEPSEYKLEDLCSQYSDLSIGIATSDYEHNLIEHYLNILKCNSDSSGSSSCFDHGSRSEESFEKQINLLEQNNRELMKWINEFNNGEESQPNNAQPNLNRSNGEVFFNELKCLRKKTADLEDYLTILKERRKNLVLQLNDLMKSMQ